jgi:hypothetical protein
MVLNVKHDDARKVGTPARASDIPELPHGRHHDVIHEVRRCHDDLTHYFASIELIDAGENGTPRSLRCPRTARSAEISLSDRLLPDRLRTSGLNLRGSRGTLFLVG